MPSRAFSARALFLPLPRACSLSAVPLRTLVETACSRFVASTARLVLDAALGLFVEEDEEDDEEEDEEDEDEEDEDEGGVAEEDA